MARIACWGLLVASTFVVASACGSSETKKKAPRDDAGAGAGEGGGGQNTGGSQSEAGTPGVGEGGAGATADGGSPLGSGGLGGGEALGGTGANEGGSNGLAGAAGSGGEAAGGNTPDLTACDAVGEACCAGSCATDLSCAGTNCTCVGTFHGQMTIRADGRLLRVAGGQTPIKNSLTAETITEVTSAWEGHYHGCLSRLDGSAWCYATDTAGNNQGQLGNGIMAPNTPATTAVRVQVDPGAQQGPIYLENVSSMQQGFTGYLGSGNCALTSDGAVYCWGVKTDGNLMQTGKNEAYATPIKLNANSNISNAFQVAVGSRHACYVTDETEVYCWGANIGGPLGNGTEAASLYPVRAGALTGVLKVTAGPDFSCAMVAAGADAGRVFCWGSSGAGQLGIGAPAANWDGCINYCKTSPTRVRVDANTYLEDVVDIASGYQTTCAIRSDQTVWCWGASGGQYATAMQAPAGTAITGVGALSVHSGTPRVMLLDGSLFDLPSATTKTAVSVNCGLLD